MTAATVAMDYEEEVMPQPAQILLIHQPLPITASSATSAVSADTAAAAAAAATAITASATATTITPLSPVALVTQVPLTAAPAASPLISNHTAAAAGPIIYSQRLPPGRLPHVQPPVLCPETRSRVIIEAIDALRSRKARPDEARITHWVNRRYGIQKDDAVNIIHQSVAEGSVIRVKYKDSISYRNPAKFPRSAAQVNLLMKQRLAQQQQQQQSNGCKSNDAEKDVHSADGLVRAAAAAPAGSMTGAQPLAPIPAIKKILRAIRTLTTKSADPSAGASVQQVINLIGQRELGFPPSFVSRVLKAGVIQGTVRLLPSGNYILASGSLKKKGVNRKSQSQMSPVAQTNGSPSKAGQKVLLIAPKSKQQTLLQPQSFTGSVPAASEATAAGDCGSMTTAPNSMSQVPPPPPLMLQQIQSQQPVQMQSPHNQQQRSHAAAPVMQNSVPLVRRHKKMNMQKYQKLLVNRQVGGARHHMSAGSSAAAKSEVERGRPISQRKKFKKNLGPDFLEPSDLGMPYLQNSFEPKCDYCDRPASRSPRGKHEEFLVCKDCDFKAHPKSCLKYSEELISRCRESEWQCQYCKDCCMCDKSGDVESILFCDACDQGYHMACHNPPLASKPDGAWICTSCQIRRKNKVKSKPGRNENTASDDGFEEESEESAESVDDEEEVDDRSNSQDEVRIHKQRKDSTDKILSQLQPAIELLPEQHPHMPTKAQDWSCDDVETFVRFIGFPDQAVTFREQEIDGLSLLLLKRSDLLSGMDLKLGPAVKIYGHVQRLQMMKQNADTNAVVTLDETQTPAE